MGDSRSHYAEVLAPVYTWMYGGFPAALRRNAELFAARGIGPPQASGRALDLGAGSGFQAIPLARLGYTVTAIDFDPGLLAELAGEAGDLPIVRIEGDLLEFRQHVAGRVELVVCMTDTLLHLESFEQVGRLIADVHAALEPGGKFVLSFRDYTHELKALDRFIPVRSGDDTIVTCFLEYEASHVKVHDLVHRRLDGVWRFSRSFYRKLRLSPDKIRQTLVAAGFSRVETDVQSGMVVMIAARE